MILGDVLLATMGLQSIVHDLIRFCVPKSCVEHTQVAAQRIFIHFLCRRGLKPERLKFENGSVRVSDAIQMDKAS